VALLITLEPIQNRMSFKQFSAFISYAHLDGEALASALRDQVHLDPRGRSITFWQDYDRIKYGQWTKQIEEAIDSSDFLILLITPAALASSNCKNEWMYARKNGVAILPINGRPNDSSFYDSFPNWLKRQHIYNLEKNWERFINDLNSQPQISKVPITAPRLSEVQNYVERPEKLLRLKSILLNEKTSGPVTIILNGTGGFGKTTLAIAICNDDDILNAFDEGILWVTLGEKKNIALSVLQKLYEAVSTEKISFIDIEQAQQKLKDRLESKYCLIVLDDVWHRSDVESVLKALAGNTVLLTTRISRLLENAMQEEVREMVVEEAVQLLTGTRALNHFPRIQLEELAEELGNWPLLLKLIGAQLRVRAEEGETGDQAIDHIKRKLQKKGLASFDADDADSRTNSVNVCLNASIEILKASEQEKLFSLAIFHKAEDIPISALEKLWQMDNLDAEELLERFHRYALLDYNLPARVINMHDILIEYYKMHLASAPSVQKQFMEAMGHYSSWKDRYIWKYCVWHLVEAGEAQAAYRLLTDYNWIFGKLKITNSVYEIAKDCRIVAHGPEIQYLYQTLLLSAKVIAHSIHYLPNQLYGRLGGLDNPACKQLAEQAQKALLKYRFSLVSLFPDLEKPDLKNLVLRGHTESINGILPVANQAISWSSDGTIRLWDLSTGEQTLDISGSSYPILGAILSENDLITWTTWTLFSSDIRTGEVKFFFEMQPFGLCSISGAKLVGNELITWSELENTIESRDILTGKNKRSFQGHTGYISGMLISQDILVSWSHDSTLRIWDIRTGEQRQILEGHTDHVSGAILYNDTEVISWSKDKTIRSWNILTGVQKRIFIRHSKALEGALIKGNDLISWSGNMLYIWDIQTGEQKGSIKSQRSESLEYLSDSIKGVVIYKNDCFMWWGDKAFVLYNIYSNQKRVFKGHAHKIKDLLIHGDKLISWSDDKTIRTWDIMTGEQKDIFRGHFRSIKGVVIRKDLLISWANDFNIRIWDLNKVQEKDGKLSKHSDQINGTLLFGDKMVSWSEDSTIKVWDNFTGLEKKTFMEHRYAVKGAIFYGDDIISWSYSCFIRWNMTTGLVTRVVEDEDYSAKEVIIYDEKFLITRGTYGDLAAWDFLTGRLIRTFPDSSSAIGILSSNNTLISRLEYKNDLFSWDVTTGEPKHIFKAHTGNVSGALIHDGQLISWSEDKTLRLWDISTGEQKRLFEGHSDEVRGAFIRANVLVSWSEEEMISWDLTNAGLLNKLDLGGVACGVQAYGQLLYIIDKNYSLWVLDFLSSDTITSYSVDANITSLTVATGKNRIILGDASGGIHFLTPVGFEV
jgi:WD40 repeat protein